MKRRIVWRTGIATANQAGEAGILLPAHILAAAIQTTLPPFPGLSAAELFTCRILAAIAELGQPERLLAIKPPIGVVAALTYAAKPLLCAPTCSRVDLTYLGGAKSYRELRELLELFRHVTCEFGWGVVSGYDQEAFIKLAVDDFLYSTNNPHIYIRGGTGDVLVQNNAVGG